MNILRKFFVGVLSGLLGVVLLGVAWTSIGAATIRNKQVVGGWLDKSNFYGHVADITLEKLEKNSQNNGQESIPFSDPHVKTIVKNVLTSDTIKTNVSTVLDSTYGWLGGSDKDLAFKLDFSPLKDQVVTELSAYTKIRAATLPACGAVDGNSAVDPLTATCLPRGTSPDQVAVLAHKYLVSQDFLKNPVILGSDIMVTQNGQKVPLTSDSKVLLARKAYMASGLFPVALTVIAILLIIGIVFISSSKIRGVAKVGTTLLTTGIGLLILFVGLGYFFDWGVKHINSTAGGADSQQKLTIDLVRVVLHDVERGLLAFTVAYIVLGIGAHIVALLLKKRRPAYRKQPKVAETAVAAEEAPESTVTEETQERDLSPVEPRPATPSAPELPKRPRPPRKLQF